MPILAINTSANFVSIALLQGDKVLGGRDSRHDFQPASQSQTSQTAGSQDKLPVGYTKKRSKRGQATQRVFPPGVSVMLAPLIQDLLDSSDITFSDLELVAVAKGPGMFTGLRVGIVTAKTLAFAAQIDLVGVNSLEALAGQCFESGPESIQDKTLTCVTNAQRQQLFCGQFRRESPWNIQALPQESIIDRAEWVANLTAENVVAGSGLAPIQAEVDKSGATILPESLWDLTAESVGRLAMEKHRQGIRDDYWSLEPEYFRPSAAEEKAARATR